MWVASKKQEVSTFHVNLADCSNVTRSGFVFYNVEIILILTDISGNSRVRNSKYPRHEKNGGWRGVETGKSCKYQVAELWKLEGGKSKFCSIFSSPQSHFPLPSSLVTFKGTACIAGNRTGRDTMNLIFKDLSLLVLSGGSLKDRLRRIAFILPN